MWRAKWVALAALLSACGPSLVNLSVKSPVGTNMNRPMYMLVRQVDPKQYANEAYTEVAAKVGAPDPTVLQTAVIYPGTIQRFKVKPPKEGVLAVSFLFTAPDGNWQMLVSPQQTTSIDVELTTSRILHDSAPKDGDEKEAPAGPAAPEAPKVAAPKAPDPSKLLSSGGDQ